MDALIINGHQFLIDDDNNLGDFQRNHTLN